MLPLPELKAWEEHSSTGLPAAVSTYRKPADRQGPWRNRGSDSPQSIWIWGNVKHENELEWRRAGSGHRSSCAPLGWACFAPVWRRDRCRGIAVLGSCRRPSGRLEAGATRTRASWRRCRLEACGTGEGQAGSLRYGGPTAARADPLRASASAGSRGRASWRRCPSAPGSLPGPRNPPWSHRDCPRRRTRRCWCL